MKDALPFRNAVVVLTVVPSPSVSAAVTRPSPVPVASSWRRACEPVGTTPASVGSAVTLNGTEPTSELFT